MNETRQATIGHRPITPHTILDERLAELQEKIEALGSSRELLDLVQDCRNLSSPLEDYISAHSSRPSDDLNNLEMRTNDLDWDAAFEDKQTGLRLEKEMLSGGVEGQFLKMLTAISKAKNVLEIGSFTGYATLAMAEALPDDGKIIACEYDFFTAEFAKSQWANSPHGKKIQVRIGDALQTLKKLEEEKHLFDLVFIDADKENYHSYYSLLFDLNLIKKEGLICVDNTLYMGQVYSPANITTNGKAIQKFNKAVAEDKRVQQVLLPLRDGVTVIRRID